MREYGRLSKGRGFAVIVSSGLFRGRVRFDVRIWYEARPGDPETLRPTRQGVSIPTRDLPALRAALEEAEADALREGHIAGADYSRAGLPLPEALRGSLVSGSEDGKEPIPLRRGRERA